jgi:hypothetical protein
MWPCGGYACFNLVRSNINIRCAVLQVSKAQYDRVWGYIESGKSEGAKVVLGGEKRPGKGYFVDPTSQSSRLLVHRNLFPT